MIPSSRLIRRHRKLQTCLWEEKIINIHKSSTQTSFHLFSTDIPGLTNITMENHHF